MYRKNLWRSRFIITTTIVVMFKTDKLNLIRDKYGRTLFLGKRNDG